MKKYVLGKMLKILLSFSLAFFLVSCAAGPAKKSPTIKEEPTITLFVNDTGQKKSMKIEEYLAGVVAAEMDVSWPVNALAAQTILARTFTMENIKAGRIKKLHGTDASTSVEEFQAYAPEKINENVRKAINMTRGQVVTYQGNYIKAWFSACDGGVSASAKEGLNYIKTPTPYLNVGVKDNCLSITTPENVSWRSEIPIEQVRSAVKETTGSDPGVVKNVSIASKGPSGRVEKIKIGNATVGGPAFRLAADSTRVRSMLLSDVAVAGDSMVISGKGFGHGVGMCQWGANLLSRNGKSPKEIVSFYFKDVRVDKMWQ